MAPVVGGLIARYASWAAIFWFMAGIGVALWLINWRALPETLPAAQRSRFNVGQLMRGYRELLLDARFMLLAFASGVPFNGMFLYVLAAPAFLGKILHLQPTQFFWFFVINISGIMAGSWLSGRKAGQIAPRQQIMQGFGIMLAVSVLNMLANYWLAPAAWWSILLVATYALGWALMMPAVTLLALDLHPHRRGMASSLQAAIGSVANGLVAGVLVPVVMHSALSCFAYQQDKNSINNLTLSIKAGEKVAILGKIGSGKSTALKLATGLYEPKEGNITLDNVDLRQIDPNFLRNQVLLLEQNPRLFFGTLRDNLNLARMDSFSSDQELLQALANFGLADLIRNHPRGLDMPLGENGLGLSGGQKQVIALARMTTRNPRVALLDEPTTGLDQASEVQALQVIAKWAKNKTMVIVTHRTQVLQIVDRVIVIDNGQVVMDGPRDTIINRLAQKPSQTAH